uniref:Translation initiation factor IF-2, chloroplastic n=1 Tax=Thaumatella adunca TaxID=2006976 RepID=A0A1Z1MNW3_9FLOR|nr:translation initiation factor 2 [Thaumatella adunca]ARW67444.1 translation initiation factor 2 [Thaumatella adunca]
MSYIFLKPYYYFQFNYKIINIFNSFYNLEYNDTILKLANPKLIYFFNLSSNNLSNVINVNNIATDIVNTKLSTPSKFEKKYKTNSQDNVETKKNKNKLIKKKRKNSDHIENEELFIDTQDEVFTQEPLSLSSLKSRKNNNKYKKKSKFKGDNNILDVDLINIDQQMSNNSNMQKSIIVSDHLTIQELSLKLCIPEAEIITYLFLTKGISATINKVLDINIIRLIALHYGFNVLEKNVLNQSNNIINEQQSVYSSSNIKRPPIITILGHVDHGKTTLLDSILKTNLVTKESGGITQAISGYEIEWTYHLKSQKLIFLDTPGHESFKTMRLRGAKVNDITLLVIALDDGIKPQTIEAINYIKEMNLSCIVVITKADKLSYSFEKIEKDLVNYDIIPEALGGDVSIVEVSALTGQNIDLLLSKICMLSLSKNLFADSMKLASGIILEAYLDKKQGPIANIIIKNGTLKLGDIIVSANLSGKVKSIKNLSNLKIQSSGPSSIVQVLGFNIVPEAGLMFEVVKKEKNVKEYFLKHSNNRNFNKLLNSLNTRLTLDVNSSIKQFQIILKTDTQGSLEAIIELLSNIPQSKVQINITFANFGDISNSDIKLALATKASILAFNVSCSSQINALLKKYKVICKNFNVIYDLFKYVKSFMLDLVEPEYEKNLIGHAIVQTVFKMNKGCVAGCFVNEGKLNKTCYINVYRQGNMIYEGFITSLKRMKNDVDEVSLNNECGLMSEYTLWQESDVIDAYELVSKDKSL